MTVQDVMRIVDGATLPTIMTQREALEYLEELAAELDSRIDALRHEIENGPDE